MECSSRFTFRAPHPLAGKSSAKAQTWERFLHRIGHLSLAAPPPALSRRSCSGSVDCSICSFPASCLLNGYVFDRAWDITGLRATQKSASSVCWRWHHGSKPVASSASSPHADPLRRCHPRERAGLSQLEVAACRFNGWAASALRLGVFASLRDTLRPLAVGRRPSVSPQSA